MNRQSEKKHLFIINPVAGGNRTKKLIPQIEKICSSLHMNYEIKVSEYPGHSVDIASEVNTSRYRAVISVGGDGTLFEIVNGLLSKNINIPLGLIPTGTGNDFIKNTGIPKNLEKALSIIDNFNTKTVDAVKLNDKFFINIASVGLDAEIAGNVKHFKKAFPGTAAYIASIFYTLKNYKCIDVCIEFDNKHTIKKEILLLAVSNGKCYGGGMKVTPFAEINDGWLDICLVNRISKLKIPFLIPKFFTGNHIGLPYVELLKSKSVRIKSDSPLMINLDGELDKSTVVNIEIISNGITIIVP